MTAIVDELKKDHKDIAAVLDEVSKLGVTSKEGQDKLLHAKMGLLAHLKKEDEKIYPILKKAAETDRNLKDTLDLFAGDMQNISKQALDFFEKYSKGGAGMEFAKDIGRLFTVLKSRISKEEDILYKEFERVNK